MEIGELAFPTREGLARGDVPWEVRPSMEQGMTSSNASVICRVGSLLAVAVLLIVEHAAAQTMQGLGFLPNGRSSRASAVSADGNRVVGGATALDGNTEAFLWSPRTGMVGLGFPNNHENSSANDIS